MIYIYLYINHLKIFMENNASLNDLCIDIYNFSESDDNDDVISDYDISDDDISDMILDNPKFISEIERFSFEYYRRKGDPPNLKPLQKILSSLSLSSTSIKHIKFSGSIGFEKDIENVIQSQSQLSSIVFHSLSISPLLLNFFKYFNIN